MKYSIEPLAATPQDAELKSMGHILWLQTNQQKTPKCYLQFLHYEKYRGAKVTKRLEEVSKRS
jgi:hypothetical protein